MSSRIIRIVPCPNIAHLWPRRQGRGRRGAAWRGVAAAGRAATAQLERYLADERLARQFPGVRFIGLIVVFHGWEMVFCDAVRR